MYLLSRHEIKDLADQTADPSLSLYLPTHQAGPDARQDRIRLKNLLRAGQDLLEKRGLRAAEIDRLLEPARELDGYSTFWNTQSSGLALFLSADFFRYYRLPLAFDEFEDRFVLKPLLPLLTDNGRYFVLGLTQGGSTLYQGTHYAVAEVPVEQLPKDLADALRFDDPQRQTQYRTISSVQSRFAGGRQPAVFHSHGVGTDEAKTNILRYFQQVDRALHSVLKDDPVPLVLAGVGYLLPIYRQANRYPHLVEGDVPTNPDDLSPDELRRRAWQTVEPLFHEGRRRALDAFSQLDGTGRTSKDLSEIILAAVDGRVEALFLQEGAQQWGTLDRASRTVKSREQRAPGDEDLLDLAAVRTFSQGGRVFTLQAEEMPAKKPFAALFRY
jgi:hypothetical protein